MTKLPSLTLKRILRRHKKNPKDKEFHKVIETGSIKKKEFLGFITKATLAEKNDD